MCSLLFNAIYSCSGDKTHLEYKINESEATILIWKNLFSDVEILTENFYSILIFTEYFIHQMAFDNPNVYFYKKT